MTRWRRTTAIGIGLVWAAVGAQAEFVRDTGAGAALQAREWGLVCGGCPAADNDLASTTSFAQALSTDAAVAGDYWRGYANAAMTGAFTGVIAELSADAAASSDRHTGTVNGFTNPNTLWLSQVYAFADVSMLLINDQPTAMHYTITVDLAWVFGTSPSMGRAVPSTVIGGATAFAFDPDPFGEGGDILGFTSDSDTSPGLTFYEGASTGQFDVVIPKDGKFWLWAYAGADATAVETTLDPVTGVSAVATDAHLLTRVAMVATPVPEPPAALLGLAGLLVLGMLRRYRIIRPSVWKSE